MVPAIEALGRSVTPPSHFPGRVDRVQDELKMYAIVCSRIRPMINDAAHIQEIPEDRVGFLDALR